MAIDDDIASGTGTPSDDAGPDAEATIRRVLDRSRLAVLATQRQGQPHASLMAYAPVNGLRQLVFATYRGTMKHQNLLEDGRVAVLVDDRDSDITGPGHHLVVTATGVASEIPRDERQANVDALLSRHPELGTFLDSPDCSMVRVIVRAYQVVGGIDDVQWYHIDE